MNGQMLTFVSGISHIALNVPDIALAQKQYEALGFAEDAPGVIEEESFGIVAKVMRMGAHTIELCAPLGEGSPLMGMVGGKAYALDHICYEVSDMDAQIELLKKYKFIQTSPKRVSGVWNKKVVLMANRKMGVIELMEK